MSNNRHTGTSVGNYEMKRGPNINTVFVTVTVFEAPLFLAVASAQGYRSRYVSCFFTVE